MKSKKVIDMINSLIGDESLEENSYRLYELLESVGIQEGIDYCYDEGEFLVPDEVDLSLEKLDVNVSKFPTVKFSTTPNGDIEAEFITSNQVVKTVKITPDVVRILSYKSR